MNTTYFRNRITNEIYKHPHGYPLKTYGVILVFNEEDGYTYNKRIDSLKIVSTDCPDTALKFLDKQMYLEDKRRLGYIQEISQVNLVCEDAYFLVANNVLFTRNEQIERIYFEKPECKHDYEVCNTPELQENTITIVLECSKCGCSIIKNFELEL